MTTNALQLTPERVARRQRVLEIGCALPEALATGETHIKFTVRQKTFAYYLFDHHGDSRIALHCKVPLGEQQSFIESDPSRFAMPAYLGAKGWIAFWLDQKTLDKDAGLGHSSGIGTHFLYTDCAEEIAAPDGLTKAQKEAVARFSTWQKRTLVLN